MRILGFEITIRSGAVVDLERRASWLTYLTPPPSEECRAGRHELYVGSSARGFVHFLYCRRRTCDYRAIVKGHL